MTSPSPLTELQALGQAFDGGWRDIASAPKDGSSILLWRDDWDQPIIGRWVCCYDFLTDSEIEASGMDDDALSLSDWFGADFIQGQRLENDQHPTHWMPLPAPELIAAGVVPAKGS